MDSQWLAENRAFVIETFLKNNEYFIPIPLQFRAHFNVGHHGVISNQKKNQSGLTIFETRLLHAKSNPVIDLGQFERRETLKSFIVVLSAQPVKNQLIWKFKIRMPAEYYI